MAACGMASLILNVKLQRFEELNYSNRINISSKQFNHNVICLFSKQLTANTIG